MGWGFWRCGRSFEWQAVPLVHLVIYQHSTLYTLYTQVATPSFSSYFAEIQKKRPVPEDLRFREGSEGKSKSDKQAGPRPLRADGSIIDSKVHRKAWASRWARYVLLYTVVPSSEVAARR